MSYLVRVEEGDKWMSKLQTTKKWLIDEECKDKGFCFDSECLEEDCPYIDGVREVCECALCLDRGMRKCRCQICGVEEFTECEWKKECFDGMQND